MNKKKRAKFRVVSLTVDVFRVISTTLCRNRIINIVIGFSKQMHKWAIFHQMNITKNKPTTSLHEHTAPIMVSKGLHSKPPHAHDIMHIKAKLKKLVYLEKDKCITVKLTLNELLFCTDAFLWLWFFRWGTGVVTGVTSCRRCYTDREHVTAKRKERNQTKRK